ncbi:MAG: multiheme c-type cytochrome [Bryobacteraceae bacterium]
MIPAITLVLGLAFAAQAAPGSYAGSRQCRTCHRAQFILQSASGHAHALSPVASHPLAGSFFPRSMLTRKPNFEFQFTKPPGSFGVRVSSGKTVAEKTVEWAFGAGDQAVTFVSQLDEDSYLEHHFSYYTQPRSLEVTPGHPDREPKTVQAALGVTYKTFDPDPKIMRCFECHSTGPLSLGPRMEIRPSEPGVRCEACHGPGQAHVDAATRGETMSSRGKIQNPKRLSAAELNQLCGRCHGAPPAAGVATDWSDPWNTRRQPVYLDHSACFQKSRGALSCLTCHDAHQSVRKNDAPYYTAVCGKCHKAASHPRLRTASQTSLARCVDCHMPRVVPQAGLRFTNHWIGIYSDGATLAPMRP